MLRKRTIDIIRRDIRLGAVRIDQVMDDLITRAIGEVLEGRYISLMGVLRFGDFCWRGAGALSIVAAATAIVAVVVVIGGIWGQRGLAGIMVVYC